MVVKVRIVVNLGGGSARAGTQKDYLGSWWGSVSWSGCWLHGCIQFMEFSPAAHSSCVNSSVCMWCFNEECVCSKNPKLPLTHWGCSSLSVYPSLFGFGSYGQKTEAEATPAARPVCQLHGHLISPVRVLICKWDFWQYPTHKSSWGFNNAIYLFNFGCSRSLEKEMATHSSILAWRILWTKEPGGLQSMGSRRVGHNWAINTE